MNKAKLDCCMSLYLIFMLQRNLMGKLKWTDWVGYLSECFTLILFYSSDYPDVGFKQAYELLFLWTSSKKHSYAVAWMISLLHKTPHNLFYCDRIGSAINTWVWLSSDEETISSRPTTQYLFRTYLCCFLSLRLSLIGLTWWAKLTTK